ncbi:MAG: ATP-binding protein [Sulfurimonas sp.]|uniref:ATP-binding protein n=1 Tax=Sulfurimonas sp. TaxID=2022749 RepID=UPI0025CEA78D|nr:ATP-binding protein [Sulfurimonas sp.]MCK9491590.1 ATP-binding protein [Sulfurimonas sp.]
MTQTQIDELLANFLISKEDLESRVVFCEFAHSISNIVVDDFVKNYLLKNPKLSIYLAHTDANRLIKNIKEFIAFVLTAPIDESYIDRIHYIGSIHFSIKLEPPKVVHGFLAINEVLKKLAKVNEFVKQHICLIKKILRLVEYVMNDGYYIQKNKIYTDSIQNLKGFNAQNELYIGFEYHKQNMKKIDSIKDAKSTIKNIDNIQEDSKKCAFGKILDILKNDEKYEYILSDKLQSVTSLHDEWHKEFVAFKQALKEDDKELMQGSKDNISNITQELKEVLDKSLNKSIEDGHVALNAGIKSMKNITELFHKKEYFDDFDKMFRSVLQKTFDEFQWAIDDIYIDHNTLADDSYNIKKMLRHSAKNIYLGIRLKQDYANDYVYEMLSILIEVLDLHFSAKERESSLISFADKAENANKSKDIFLANMSHELRTPLNAITGFSQIIMMKKDTPDTIKNYVVKIHIAGKNLLDLVNTILDFAKLEAGKMQFSPKLSNISSVISEVSTLVQPLAQEKNIKLKMPNIVSLNLYIDAKLFKQVLINLLTNAIKFTNNNGNVSLNVTYDAKKQMYEFEVKDSGIGLSTESISKLFQAFSQIDSDYQKLQQGTGLGLMISKKIIEELHKGNIWVQSKLGEGSSFFVNMPTPMIESHTYSISEAPKDARNALIVEDSTSYQKILAEHLRKSVNLTFTDTVNKAKSLLLNNKYDFVILDFFLTDGISSEVLEFMEKEGILVSTIVISAEDEITISSSLSGSTNLEAIINKNNIDQICASIKGENFSE